MTDFTQAADALKRMAVQYKNIVAVADALDSLGSVENATKEAEAALAKARKDRDAFFDKFKAEHARAEEQLLTAKSDANLVIAEAKEDAVHLKAKAIAAGEVKAAAMIAAAQAAANVATGEVESKVKKAQAELEDTTMKVELAASALSGLTADVEKMQTQHDKLEKALADLKAKFA